MDGEYNVPTGAPQVLEGARYLREAGSQLIKLRLTWSPGWGQPALADTADLVQVAGHPSVQALFQQPFRVYVLWVYRPGLLPNYWVNGVTDEQYAAERDATRQLCEHLMDTYQGSDKVFLFSHWEGDWALGGYELFDPAKNPSATAIDGMIRWLTARHEGVEACRSKRLGRSIGVYDSTEVNLVWQAIDDPSALRVVNAVLPAVPVDLVSYSSWDSLFFRQTLSPSDPLSVNLERIRNHLGQAIDFIEANARDTGPFGQKNVFLGEYGLPEAELLEQGYSQDDLQRLVEEMNLVAIRKGMPFAVFWQVFCNDCSAVDGQKKCRGFWMVDADGNRRSPFRAIQWQTAAIAFTRTAYHHYLQRLPEAEAMGNAVDYLRRPSHFPVYSDTLRNSAEARQKLSDPDFVDRAFRAVLGRPPANTESTNALSMLARDTQRSALLRFLIDVPEGAERLADPAFVDRLYQLILGRSADSAGKSNALQSLRAGGQRSSLLDAFLASDEFRFGRRFETTEPSALDSIFWFPNLAP